MYTEELLKQGAEGNTAAQEQLLLENKGLIYMVVSRFKYHTQELDDLYQIASIGFLKALKRFDFSLNLSFSTYAIPVMMGEVKRYLRDNQPIKISRSYKEITARAQKIRELMIQKNGIEPTMQELAEQLKIERETLAEAFSATRAPESLDKLQSEGDAALSCAVQDKQELTTVNRLALKEMIQTLTEREQLLLKLRYINELTQSQIAVFLGISQVQVSRLEKKILCNLRQQFQSE